MATTRPGASRRDETTFTRNLRWEAFGEEGRALVGSWTIAVSLGIAWLLLVFFGPEAAADINLTPPPENVTINVTPEDPPEPEPIPVEAAPSPAPTAAPRQPRPRGGGESGPTAAQAASAFGGGNESGLISDVAGALRGVDVSRSSGAAVGGGKAVLGTGTGGAGTRTPGRGGLGAGTGAASGIGGVSGTGGVGRAAVGVGMPRVVAPPVGGPARDVGELGSYVRSRQQQLQFCYQEFGLKVNPNLAGTVGVLVRLASNGSVSDASITSRTWSGPGASETESCIRQKVRQWRFPSSDRGGDGEYGFSFSFSR